MRPAAIATQPRRHRRYQEFTVGFGIGLAETAESTGAALLHPDRLRGNGYGVLGLVQSMGALTSALLVGFRWTAFTPTLAFGTPPRGCLPQPSQRS